MPCIRPQRAGGAIGLFRAADGRAKIHHRLGKIAGPVRRSHVARRVSGFLRGPDRGVARSHDSAQRPGRHWCRSPSPARRRRSPRWPPPYIRQARARSRNSGFGSRESAAPHDFPGAGDQVAGAGVIAEPGPFAENRFIVRGRQCFDSRPAFDEAAKARFHRGDRRLLKHDLAQPDDIRFGRRRPRRASPGQRPCIGIIMSEEPDRGRVVCR